MTFTVSFVVHCYKLTHPLPKCMESVLYQTYRSFEVLIMNGCSPQTHLSMTVPHARECREVWRRGCRNALGHRAQSRRSSEITAEKSLIA
jgi:hypothetical protein